MIFWNMLATPNTGGEAPVAGVAPVASAKAAELPRDAVSNVIQLPPRSPIDEPAGLAAPLATLTQPADTAPQPRGLLDAPEVKAFFANNHFGLGRHNGANYKTQEALALGSQSLVSKFQNALAGLVEQKQAKADRLRNTQLQTEGLCNTTTAQLNLSCTRLERDMAVLRDQMAQATAGKGWVLSALNEYQIGFNKGLREAIDFELISN
jgi:hypothetical protein